MHYRLLGEWAGIIAALIFAGCLFFSLVLMFVPPIALPLSDYVSVAHRFMLFERGEMSFPEFVMRKHVDHNHALIYLLSAVDIWAFGGRLWLQFVLSILSHLAVYLVLLLAIWRASQKDLLMGVFLAFMGTQLFSVYGAETWAFPFQAVLPSFRAIFLAGLMAYAWAVVATAPAWVLPVSLALLFTAAISHGSGLFVFLSALAVASIARNSRALFATLVFSAVFLVYEVVFPPANSAREQFFSVLSGGVLDPLYFTCSLLGAYLLWGGNVMAQVWVGGAGLTAFVISACVLVAQGWRDRWPLAFVTAVAGFSLASTFASVALNIFYAPERGVAVLEPSYFQSSRYLETTSGFWIGLFAMAFSHGSWRLRSIVAGGMAVSVYCAIANTKDVRGIWERTYVHSQVASEIIAAGEWRLMPDETLAEALLLPTSMAGMARDVLQFQEDRQMGVFAGGLADAASSSSPVNWSDANWTGGVSLTQPMILLPNTEANRSAFIVGALLSFQSDVRKIVAEPQESGIFLRVTVSGESLDLSVAPFPNRFTFAAHDSPHY